MRRMRRNPGKPIVLVLELAACGPNQRDPSTNPDGSGGGDGNGGGGDGSGTNGDGCSDEAKLVYVVDQNRKLSQFNPPTKTFTDLGTLACPAGGASPFSMAIARDATAYILYDNGELFRVETKNNLACTKTAWVPSAQGLRVFGMGFSTDQVGGTSDTLFIAGGSTVSSSSSSLAKVDMGTFKPTSVGTVSGWPELTGTGKAELWGFFPATTGTRVVQIEKTSGSAVRTYTLSGLAGDPRAAAATPCS